MFSCIVSQHQDRVQQSPKPRSHDRVSARKPVVRFTKILTVGACLCQAGRLAPRKETDDPNTFRTRSGGRTPRLTLPSQPLAVSSALDDSRAEGSSDRPVGPALSKHKSRVDWYGQHAVAFVTNFTYILREHGVGAGLGSVATTYEAREGKSGIRESVPDRDTGRYQAHFHSLTDLHTHISRTQPRRHHDSRDRQGTGQRPAGKRKCNREEK
jgi:hypothetical protein